MSILDKLRAGDQDKPLAYAILYSPGTAAALVLASGLLLAIGQTRTIVDAVALVHPLWGEGWLWTVAIGFETAILGVGLVMAMTGDKTLWRWELVLVGASVVAGLAVGLHGQDVDTWTAAGVALGRALAVGLLPVQYLAVVLTGHKLAHAAPGQDTPATPERQEPRQPAAKASAIPAPPARVQTPAPVALGFQTPARAASGGGGRGAQDVAVAEAAGVSVRTARRWRTEGSAGYDPRRYQKVLEEVEG